MDDLDWKNCPVRLGQSRGGVLAFADCWDGVVRGDVAPWPPPELIQKLYESRQSRAFSTESLSELERAHGFYSDLQSMHSEDAVTWSLFGPLAYASPTIRGPFVSELLELLGVRTVVTSSNIWLWRRIPHPDSRVSGGPEIDFGIQTDRVLILGEAKWRSPVGIGQGVGRDKDQIQLRVQFCKEYGPKLYPSIEQFIILLVEPQKSMPAPLQLKNVRTAHLTWTEIGGLSTHPWREEVLAHLEWRTSRSRA